MKFMKKNVWLMLLSLSVMSAAGCGLIPTPEPTATETPVVDTATPTVLPSPVTFVTSVPSSRAAAEGFLSAWESEDYMAMYNQLSQASRDAVTFDDFEERYESTSINLTLNSLEASITALLTNPTTAQVGYHVNYETKVAGSFERDIEMNMVYEGGSWKIQWEDGMIMPELRGGNQIKMDMSVPMRGIIYDIAGVPMANQEKAYALGVIPANVSQSAWGGLVAELSRLTGKTPQIINQILREANAYEFVPVGEVPSSVIEDRLANLSQYTGLLVNAYDATRFYYFGGSAPHIVGYVQPIGAEEVDAMRREGYAFNERIGRLGIEKWGQSMLTGERGVTLYITDADGNAITRLQRTEPVQASSIYTTFDESFNYDLQRSINGFNAAIVVIEVDTGRVLGLASSPTFDPNLLDFTNPNSNYAGSSLYGASRPLYNRASQGQYPLGSVFKTIVMAAALESGLYTVDSEMDCPYEWNGLDGITLYDWTLEHEIPPSGMLTLPESLMRSCNPWYYELGLQLYRKAGQDYIPSMARGFGLGALTEIGEIEEEPGKVETPRDELSSVQLGIGQSTLLVTPLQVARFMAAIANGGTLYRPQVVEQIIGPDEEVVYAFEPEAQGKLPVSAKNLQAIRDALSLVTTNRRGTAAHVFRPLNYQVWGKTGSAQTGPGIKPHAWFAGFTDENDPKKPDIAVAVLVENVGEGSDFAAPIFRRVIELYFDGQASLLYPWEAAVYITKTPTPTPTASRTPVPTRAPWETPPSETPTP